MNPFDQPLTDVTEGNNITDSSVTSKPKSSKEKQLKYFCGTHHLQFDQYDQTFKDFIEKQKQYIYGLETCPTTGRSHWQFFFETCNKSGIRFSTLCKAHPKTNFEICEGDKKSNFLYCSKDKNFKSNIIDIYIPELTPDMLYDWQKNIVNTITTKPDNRTIHWYWEPDGNIGKTTFAKFLSFYYDAIPLEGKKNDILFCAASFPSSVYIYDIERSLEEHLSYGAIEKIKNGYYMCAKYESKPILRPCPHVICFANFEPNYIKLSNDRWHVTKIE